MHWFFLEGAYVLHHVHGRDSNQLQKGRLANNCFMHYDNDAVQFGVNSAVNVVSI